MRQIGAAVLSASIVVGLVVVAEAQRPAVPSATPATPRTYHARRTPWGDPDLEGTWPGARAAAIPLQRPESFGTRDRLTDAEFAERQAQFDRQKDQDVADFDIEHPSIPLGQIGGPQSPPPIGSSVPRRSARRP
jgi:hypothetical protein